MTKTEWQNLMKKFGVKVEDLAEEVKDRIVEEVNDYKSQFDPVTRRTIRRNWIIIGGIFSVLTFFLGYWIHGLF